MAILTSLLLAVCVAGQPPLPAEKEPPRPDPVVKPAGGPVGPVAPAGRPRPRPTPPAQRPPYHLLLNTWLPLVYVWFIIWIARKRRRAQHEEEETKTPYTEEDLMDDWEFKILRDSLSRFTRPSFLEKTLAAESQAGWQLVEVFDGGRVRLKRRASQRQNDAGLAGIDPYRMQISIPKGFVLGMVGCGLLAAVAGILGFAALFKFLAPERGNNWYILAAVVATVLAVSCGIAAKAAKDQS